MTQRWASDGCERPEALADFAGQNAETAAAALGQPISDETFQLGKGMNEFRIELQNVLPLPANAALQVRERSWAEGDCRLTLWSTERGGKAQVVRAVRWPAGAEF